MNSSDIFWIDQSPEQGELKSVFETLADSWQNLVVTFEDAGKIAQGYLDNFQTRSIPWSDERSDPIGDILAVQKVTEENPHYRPYYTWIDEGTIFNVEIRPVNPVPVTVPLDDYGRPLLDATGGRMRVSGPDLCVRHGQERVAGRCTKCR